jgi:hypothetical protein
MKAQTSDSNLKKIQQSLSKSITTKSVVSEKDHKTKRVVSTGRKDAF